MKPIQRASDKDWHEPSDPRALRLCSVNLKGVRSAGMLYWHGGAATEGAAIDEALLALRTAWAVASSSLHETTPMPEGLVPLSKVHATYAFRSITYASAMGQRAPVQTMSWDGWVRWTIEKKFESLVKESVPRHHLRREAKIPHGRLIMAALTDDPHLTDMFRREGRLKVGGEDATKGPGSVRANVTIEVPDAAPFGLNAKPVIVHTDTLAAICAVITHAAFQYDRAGIATRVSIDIPSSATLRAAAIAHLRSNPTSMIEDFLHEHGAHELAGRLAQRRPVIHEEPWQ